MKLFNNPIKILIIVCILCFCNNLNAQGLPGDGPGGGDVTDNPGAPITGLIPLAILAGAGIGIYGLNQKKKK